MTARGSAQAISKVSYTDRFGNRQEILNFATKEDYRNTLDRLEQKYDANSDLEDEYKILLDFNREYHFTSLLQDYINAETTWLMTEDLPDATDPDNNFYGLDPIELSLLNKDRAVVIDGTILVHYQDGQAIITNGDFTVLNEILNYSSARLIVGDSVVGIGVFVFVWVGFGIYTSATGEDHSDDCRQRGRKRETFNVSGNRKVKLITKYRFQNGPFFTQAKIKLKQKAYKKRRWFGWKKTKANLKLALDGACGEGKCGISRYFHNETKEVYAKKNKKTWGLTPELFSILNKKSFFMKDDQLYARYYIDNQLITEYDLFEL